jgi:hypothetical protein
MLIVADQPPSSPPASSVPAVRRQKNRQCGFTNPASHCATAITRVTEGASCNFAKPNGVGIVHFTPRYNARGASQGFDSAPGLTIDRKHHNSALSFPSDPSRQTVGVSRIQGLVLNESLVYSQQLSWSVSPYRPRLGARSENANGGHWIFNGTASGRRQAFFDLTFGWSAADGFPRHGADMRGQTPAAAYRFDSSLDDRRGFCLAPNRDTVYIVQYLIG